MSGLEWADVRAERIQVVPPSTRLASGMGQKTNVGEFGIAAGNVVLFGDREALLGQLRKAVEWLEKQVPEWGIRWADGDVELAGYLGEQRARMLARRDGGTVVYRERPGAEWRDVES